MKRVWSLLLVASLVLTSCGRTDSMPTKETEKETNAPSWQEQYDLGIRYLSEGKYEEAVIAFTAAIEIDPKQAPAYVGRGEAYIGSGETEENLAMAQADYEMAIELDELLVEAYLGLADVYTLQEDYDKALEVLRQGLEKVSDYRIEARIYEILEVTDSFVREDIIKYTPFSELDPSLQLLIETLMDKANSSPDEAVELLSTDYQDLIDQEIAPKELRTMKNNYKIQMRFLNYNGSNPGGEFEMRPMEGTAYYCDGAYYEGQLHVNHGWGTCKDWNWNGPFEMITMDSSGTPHSESGNCVNGLLDGAIYYPNSMYNTIEQTYTPYYAVYSHGKETGKRIYNDGKEETVDYRAGTENDVFYYASRTDIGWYEYWILW